MSQTEPSINCPRCGGSNRATATFCGQCGTSLASEVACSSCGTPNDPSQRFCDGCGLALGSASSEPGPVSPGRPLPQAFGRGRYEVVRVLGEGGMKRVYLARDSQLQREVAVSAFKSEGVEQTAFLRARREAEAMGKLGDHPNVVTIYDIGDEDGELFLVSQYMSGGDLAGLLAQADDRQLAIAEVVRISTEISRALEHAHAHRVVHRDLKPQNVWLAPDGTAKLGDFGLAIAADYSRMTVEGMMVGTVAYMPPEQGLGRSADARSDLYSLGTVMYELICGAPPFAGEDAASVISQHVSTVPVGLTWHRPDVPKALEQLVLKLLAKTPEERPQSATEVREALEAIDSVSSMVASPQDDATIALDRLTQGAFLGRESETKELRKGVDQVIAGRGCLFMVAGEAGMGKTRLAAEIDSYANLRGAQVLWGRCYEGEGAPAYWPWVQVIRAYAQSREPDELAAELGSGASDIAQVVSELRGRLPDLPEPQPLDPQQARFRLFDSIANFLRNASSVRPLAIFLEDLHLADQPSLLLLQFVARELATARIFVLCTYRDAELDDDHLLGKVHASLSHESGYERMRLRGLTKRDVKALLEQASRQTLESLDELALVEAVNRESGGNPYFIEEIIRHLVESGAIYERDGRWLSDARHIDQLGIPQGIREVIDRRLSRLSEDCRGLLSTASAIGNEFSLETLERVSGVPAAAIFERVGEAMDAAIVSPVPNEGNRYRFSHAATRHALYEHLPSGDRVALHQSIGEALEVLYEERIESHLGELAHHFAQAAPAGLAAKAADYAWWAGERAVALAAYEDAVAHYTRALQLFDTLTEEPARRCQLLLALGDTRWRAGDVTLAKQTFKEAAAIAEQLSLSDQYARAALGYGGGVGGFSAADLADEQLVELLRSALEVLPDRDSALRVRVMARLAIELYYMNDRTEPDALSRSAVEMAERVGDAKITLLAMYSRQWAVMGPDGLDGDLEAGEEIIRLARLVGDAEMEFHGHHLKINTLIQLGEIDVVDREIKACEKLAKELHQPNYEWHAGVFRTMRALMQGRFEEGERLAQAAFAVGQRGRPEVAAVVFGAHAFLTSFAAGKLAELEEGGEAFAARYPSSAWPAALTWLLSEAGETAKARAAFDALARDGFQGIRRDANWLTAMACLSQACNYLEDAEAADVLYEMLSPYADHCTPILAGAACLGSNHTFLGCLAKAAGRLDAAIEHFERAFEVNQQIGAHYIGPLICYEYARAALARNGPGDRERATDLVEKGIEKARALGTTNELERLLSIKLEWQRLSDVDVQTSIDAVARSVEQTRPDLTPAVAPDGTVTIMFSDIEDSTVLTERLGDRRWLELLKRHNQILREHVTKHGGYEVKSQGDGFMLAFASAGKAIQCAIDIQLALSEHRRRHPDEPLKVRVGLHTGEMLREDADFFGKNVILAARIAAQARGDEIIVSALLRDLVLSSGDFEFDQERELELKGLSGRYRVFAVPWSPDAPGPEAEPESDGTPVPADAAEVAPGVQRRGDRSPAGSPAPDLPDQPSGVRD